MQNVDTIFFLKKKHNFLEYQKRRIWNIEYGIFFLFNVLSSGIAGDWETFIKKENPKRQI